MVEEGIQGVEVPGASPLIHKRVEKISSVDGGRKDNIFPEHVLDFTGGESFRNLVKHSHLSSVFLQSHRFFLDVHGLIDSAFSKDVLLDRTRDHEILESGLVVGTSRLEFWRRDHFDHSVVVFVGLIDLLHVFVEVFELLVRGSENRALGNFHFCVFGELI